jgi:hypothetical protein
MGRSERAAKMFRDRRGMEIGTRDAISSQTINGSSKFALRVGNKDKCAAKPYEDSQQHP